MKKLPNSLKYLQENDEIWEKVAKDIPYKYICTMFEFKNKTIDVNYNNEDIMDQPIEKRTSYSGGSVASPTNESHAGNNFTSYQPMTNATLLRITLPNEKDLSHGVS